MYSCNEFHKILQPIALHNAHFCEKILGKYRRSKKISSGFPQLLFYKIRNQAGLQKIDINFLCSLYLQDSFSCVLKGLEKLGRIFQYSEKRKFSARKETHHERSPASSTLIPLLSTKVNASERIKRTVSLLELTFSPTNPVVSIVENTVPGIKLSAPWLKTKSLGTGSDDFVLVLYTSSIKRNIPGFRREAFGNVEKSTKTLPLSTLSSKKIKPFNVNEAFFKKTAQDRRAISIVLSAPSGHPALRYNSKPEPTLSGVPNVIFGKNGYLGQDAESLYFFNQQQIDQELQQIKKTISKMEKSVSERLRSVSNPEQSNLKRDSDISSISEQVYRTIERRIIMEKEMRGL